MASPLNQHCIKPNLTAGRIGIIAGGLAMASVMQGCSTTDVYTAPYAPPVALERQPGMKDTASLASHKAHRDAVSSRPTPQTFDYASIYAGINDDGIQVPAFNYKKMNSKFLRQQVAYFGPEPAGTIVVDAKRKLLYLVQRNGMAMRYGIAVGKEGYGWTGNAIMQWKQKWPTWTPPPEMIERNPKYAKYAEGLKGSPENPLGARAMYLFKDGKDTLYRIHGTTRPFSIGKAASSGCFRMINQDVIDLYSRVDRKAAVQVREQVYAQTVGR